MRDFGCCEQGHNDREVLARLYWRNQGYEHESFDAGGLDGNSVYREAWGMADVVLAAGFRRVPEPMSDAGRGGTRDICQAMTWTGDDEVYCSLREDHNSMHDDGEGWEW